MSFNQCARLFAVLGFACGVIGCASSGHRQSSPSDWQYQGQMFGTIIVRLSGGVPENISDDVRLDLKRFEQAVRHALHERRLYDRHSGYSVVVELTEVRIPSRARPAQVGVEWVTGSVTLAEPNGKLLHRFDVSASDAPASVGNETPWRWLHAEFANSMVYQILKGSEPRYSVAAL